MRKAGDKIRLSIDSQKVNIKGKKKDFQVSGLVDQSEGGDVMRRDRNSQENIFGNFFSILNGITQQIVFKDKEEILKQYGTVLKADKLT